MYTLPISVEVNGASFGIRQNGDYRMVLDCFNALNDTELSEQERILACTIIFYEDFSSIEDLQKHEDIMETLQREMFKFFNCGEDSIQSNTGNYKLIDWDSDSLLICSAINNVAHTEVRAVEYLHWWTFMGFYMAIGECTLSHIVSIRSKIAHGEKLEKHEKKFRAENPNYFNIDYRSTQQKEADEYVKNLWGD